MEERGRGRRPSGPAKGSEWRTSALADVPRITDARGWTHLSGCVSTLKPIIGLDGQASSVGAPQMHGRALQRPAAGCHGGGGHCCARPGHGQLRDSIRTKGGGVAVLLALASTMPVVQGTGV
jgi:hypothetical protein